MRQLSCKTYIVFLGSILWGVSVFAQNPWQALRGEVGLDQVDSLYDLHGEQVVVALIDRGIDYAHPDFLDAQGQTRIAFLYDMTDPTGASAPDNPYGIGTIYTAADINAALQGGSALPTMDMMGHGIATTGIAAGNGMGLPDQRFRGVADKATIISVKGWKDGLPAVGNFPGQVGFFDPGYLLVALQFVADKVEALNLPSVTLMNLGSIGGPTDGTSEVCRAMDDFVATGRILVNTVGDDGGADNRASAPYAAGDTLDIEIEKGEAGNLRFECWYPDTDRFSVQIVYPNGTSTGVLPGPASNQGAADQFPSQVNLYHRGSDQEFYQATSPTRMIMADFTGSTGTYTMRLICTQSANGGSFSSSLNPATFNYNNRFLTYVQGNGSINDYGSAFRAITPTDYVYNNTWTDIDGVARGLTGQGDPGELWIGSSSGPTIDGRIGVDIAVPGEVIFTSYSPGTYYSQFRFNMIQGGQEYYGLQNAVSACAPLLTGVIALMLEVNPNLEPEEARDLLRNHARQDGFTGAVPNPNWGYGKLDARATIEATLETVSNGAQLLAGQGWDLYPQPAQSHLQYRWQGQQAPTALLQLSVFDLQGRLLLEKQLPASAGRLTLEDLPTGTYLLRMQAGKQLQTSLIQLMQE